MRRSKSSHKHPAEHRAPDQDAALERTFTDGTALDVLAAQGSPSADEAR